MAAIVLALLAACFITLDLGGSGLRSAHEGVRGALGSLYRGTDAGLGPARRFVQGIASAGTNQSRIAALRRENAALRGRVAAAEADRTAAAELARLRLAATSERHRVVATRVIALAPGGGFDWTATLGTGTKSGVRVGQTVTDGVGLVGRVLHADSATCLVLLAADPGSGVGARDLRSGQIGIATGRGTAGFEFVPLEPAAVVRVGDKLATGPAGSTSYVSGLAVGTVTSVRRTADGATHATVHPAVPATTLDLVGVIIEGGQAVPTVQAHR